MRLLSYELYGQSGVAIRVNGQTFPTGFSSMLELIVTGADGLERAKHVAERSEPLRDIRILAPISRPGKMLFCAINYETHQDENRAADITTNPFWFAKLPSAVIGMSDAIVLPTPETQVDYEVELAVVIGRMARSVQKQSALDYVFGYTVVNDVSARNLQMADGNYITVAKGFDTFCPMGPEIVLCDEIPDPSRLHLASYVNGERRQSEPTSNQLRTVEALVEDLSAHITLEPGDILTAGTPGGIGHHFKPPVYLRPGDVVDVEVDRVGRLSNPVLAGW